jgi:thiol-disulfide isomerase/thioredoxin
MMPDMKLWIASLLVAAMLQQPDAETRVVNYLRANVKPGQRVVVSDLVNNVFKAPDERQALQRLYNTFFKIPMAIVEFQARTKRIPTLKELSDQFAFKVAGEMDVILRIMESDSRIPRFLTRDPRTGEITQINAAVVRADPNFAKAVERSIAGAEGQQAPPYSITQFDGKPLNSTLFAGQPHLIYFWFTNCPPCVQTTPMLVRLHKKYAAQGFRIVAANADRILELSYTDAVRSRYVRDQGIQFHTAHVSPAMHQAYGNVTLFPTMYFVNRQGRIVRQLVNVQTEATLEAAIRDTLK